jgi:protein-disulfide isomerase
MSVMQSLGSALLLAVAAGSVAPIAMRSQGADQTGLQQQVEKLNAGQEALRKEIQAMQRQLLEIRTLLEARPAQAAAPQPPLPAELSTDGAPFKGSPNAPLTIVEFSDFQCPFCGRHWQQTYGQLDKEYISTGRVRYVYRHFPLERIHPQALKAGEAAECAAAQGKFWEMHDRLFANQQALMPTDLMVHSQAIGLDRARFGACLAGQMTAKVRADLALGTQAGVGSTPSFFVGTPAPGGKIKVLRKLTGALPFATFKTTINGLLAGPPPAE